MFAFYYYIVLYLSFSDRIYIFAVNELGKDSAKTVEKFRFDEKRRTLYHLRTYQDPTFTQSVLLNNVNVTKMYLSVHLSVCVYVCVSG